MKFHTNVKFVFLFPIILIITILLSVNILLNINITTKNFISNADDNLKILGMEVQNNIDHFIKNKIDLLYIILKSYDIHDDEFNKNFFNSIINDERNEFTNIFITDISGDILYGINSDNVSSLKDRPFFKRCVSSQSPSMSNINSQKDGSLSFYIIVPIKNTNRYLGASIGLSFLQKIFEHIKIEDSGYGYILNSDGKMIYHPNKNVIGTIPEQREVIEEMSLLKDNSQKMLHYKFNNIDRYVVLTKSKVTGWTIGLGAPMDELLSESYAIRNNNIMFGLGLISLVLIVLFYIAHRVVLNPIKQLLITSTQLSNGQFDTQFPSENLFIGELKSFYNSLKEMTHFIINKMSWYEQILNSIETPIFVTDNKLKIVYANNNLKKMLNISHSDIIGKQCNILKTSICNTANCAIECLQNSRQTTNFNIAGIEGKEFHVDAYFIKDEYDNNIGVIEVITDITEQINMKKAAEQAMYDGMNNAASQIESVMKNVVEISAMLDDHMNLVNQGADQQKNRITEAAAAIEEMSATIIEIARNSSEAANIANENKIQVVSGKDTIDKTTVSIINVKDINNNVDKTIDILHHKIENISSIVSVIDDIADQTNLLALNAAIEAARAGDAGRGFAVVADEVRKLADRTIMATKEINGSIKEIQSSVNQTLNEKHDANTALEQTIIYTEEINKLFEIFVKNIDKTAGIIIEIATATEEQSTTTDEINKTMESVNNISLETSLSMNESINVVHDLKDMIEKLTDVVNGLKS